MSTILLNLKSNSLGDTICFMPCANYFNKSYEEKCIKFNRLEFIPNKEAELIKYFRNSLTIVMKIAKDKLLNFKLSKNGKFQITGSKYDQHAKECIKYFWEIIRPSTELYKMSGTNFNVTFITVMTNIDFNLGFLNIKLIN